MIVDITSVRKTITAEVLDIRNTYTIDMRNIVCASYSKGFVIPWCSQVSYTINDLGILTITADWTNISTEGIQEDYGNFSTNSLALLPTLGHSDIAEDMTLNKKLGTVSFEGRDYFLFLADHRVEKHYVVVLTPLWRGGKFAFEQTVMLPDIELHVGNYVSPILNGQDDLSTINFAVYISYSPAPNTLSTKVVVELNELGDFEARLIVEGDIDLTVTPMSIVDLKVGLANHLDLRNDDDYYADE